MLLYREAGFQHLDVDYANGNAGNSEEGGSAGDLSSEKRKLFFNCFSRIEKKSLFRARLRLRPITVHLLPTEPITVPDIISLYKNGYMYFVMTT